MIQHQQEVNELIENVNQKTYAYGDVHAKKQDILMIISELKDKLKTIEKWNNVNIKFDKSTTLETNLCNTIEKNKDLKAKMVSKIEVKTDKSKPVTSCSIPKTKQCLKKNVNVIARGMYSVIKTETKIQVAKSNMFSCNSTRVASSSSARRPESKDTNLTKRCDTMNLNVSESNANVLKAKNVNVVNDGSNLVCVSCSNDVFMISHDKCVARYALSPNSRIKRALFNSPVAAKSSKIGATPVVTKSSRMELYIQGKDHGRIILNSIENGPLAWLTVELENGTVRPKTYEELFDKEKLQANCDLKATNTVLQGLPPDVYALFDKFSYLKGETMHQCYLWFAQLINDMNIIQMIMQPVQMNTKLLNSLPLEWGKFVTNVKLAGDLHLSNYDQLYAYLKQHEVQANETLLMCERFPDPLALVANYHQQPSHFNDYHSQYTTPQYQQQFSPPT
ncbi:hypothetical protein Tco_0678326 [Tanacetum coccineum]|uniref:Integrase, catalytic region, zinc finger, CCHC-type, peptidase aspartic, catalytic n=1 Tax=Tanacetum coccineum TaxID=301880 RepID=A0ABQ4XG30_9ASTR